MITEPTYANLSTTEAFAGGSILGHDLTGLPSIEFRVVRSGSPARRMRLNTTRCTLGSGEGCTVRLNDVSLRPMHAVILRDANRVLLRAYTVPIEVNGFLTGETFLSVGDTFTLGSYQFELLSGLGPEEVSLPDARTVPRRTARHQSPAWTSGHRTADDGASDGFAEDTAAASKPPRLSFLGGGTYVSEALQASPLPPSRLDSRVDASTRASQRAESEQLRREVEAWRQREQRWQEQESQTRAELADAVARFQQSQDRAKEAAESVAQMRRRMAQLTDELESLANDSIEFRQQASQRQETLRQAADSASEARELALRQCEDAQRQRDELARAYDEATRERDEATRGRDEAIRQRDEATRQRGEQDAAQNEVILELESVRRDRELVAAQLADALNQLDQANEQRQRAIGERDEAVAQQRQAVLERQDIDQQASTLALTQTQAQIAALTGDLAEAGEQLRLAREEVTAAYARIEELSGELGRYRDQLSMRDQSIDEQSAHYESLLEELRGQVHRLQAECAEARDHAASAANDRHLAESLQSRLSMTESQRQSDRLSWEQEATALQEAVQQLSLELASASGRLSQTQADHEATQAELNDAYERLTVARRELAARPTCEQWDDLQNQLAETEQELEETERLLELLRSDYDELLGRQPASSASTGSATSNAAIADSPVGSTPAADLAAVHLVAEIEHEQPLAAVQEPQLPSASEPADMGWPTYQLSGDEASQPPADESDAEQEVWAADTAEIADRLQSYTRRDEARHGAIESIPQPELSPGDDIDHCEADSDRSLGSIAKKLIEQLGEANALDGQNDDDILDQDSPPEQANAAYDADEREPVHAEDAADNWKPVQAPAVWNLPSSYSPVDWQRSSAAASDDSDADAEANSERTFVLPADGAFNDIDGDAMVSDPPWIKGGFGSDTDAAAGGWDRQEVAEPEHLDGCTRPFDFGTTRDPLRHGESIELESTEADSTEAASPELDSPEIESTEIESVDYQSVDLGSADFESADGEQAGDLSSERDQDAASGAEATNAEDDSIEAYMNRLLQRVQGHSGTTTAKTTTAGKAAAQATEKTSTTSVTGVTKVSKETELTSASKSTEVIDSNTPLVPRSQAPEDAGNMAAMRELANATANSAISMSVRSQAQQLKSRAVMDVLQAGVVMVCAFAFYTCGIKIPNLQYVWHTAAALAAALSIFFVIDMLKKLKAAKAAYDRANVQDESDVTED